MTEGETLPIVRGHRYSQMSLGAVNICEIERFRDARTILRNVDNQMIRVRGTMMEADPEPNCDGEHTQGQES